MYSPDGKYIVKVSVNNFYNDIKLQDINGSITIYNASSFKEIKQYSYNFDRQIDSVQFAGDYILIFAENMDYISYILKYK
ncbi:MAG: hypothetical protein A2Y15_02205 [Clostridiales bacterium GWF2_36_10]|nr:MAG: hypothetical protein A2Y15_02205 [Clostridiales bacterium GWF2_36_10]HAN21291.1 hypothetical protein [Clostridiales bacterium]